MSRIKFYKETSVQRSRLKARRRIKPVPPATQEDQNQLLSALKSSSANPIVFSCFDGYSEPFHWKKKPKADPKLPVSLRTLYSLSNSELADAELISKCEEVLRTIKISVDQQAYLYDITKAQSDCLDWYEQREGRITSFTAHSVLHTDIQNPSKSLLKSICFPDKKELRVPAVLWGKENEKDALKDYEQTMKTMVPQHINWSCQKAGLLVDTDLPFIGASADGVTLCDCHGKRVIEVKCPYSFRDKTLQEFFSRSKLLYLLENGEKIYWKMQFLYKIFGQNKILCQPTIPSFFRAETWNTYIFFWPKVHSDTYMWMYMSPCTMYI